MSSRGLGDVYKRQGGRPSQRTAALTAAIAALKATEWLPIESAPTARRQFFLAFVGGVVVMAHHFDREIWQAGEPNGNFDCYPIHPTHWMHLPQPPKESE